MPTMVYPLLFIILLMPTPFLAFLFIYRTIEKKAKKTILLLPDDVLIKYTDTRIWFKGYDMAKRPNRFQFDLLKSLYVYNLADLYVFKRGIVVVGKARAPLQFGRNWLLSPFVICWPGAASDFPMVRYRVNYIGTEILGEDVDIEFQDPEYTKNIKLAVKHVGRELYSKLTAVD